MPSLSKLPGSIKRKKLIKALERVGFEVSKTAGNGSHYKVTWPKTQKSLTLPYQIEKQILAYILKEIERISDLKWEDIRNNL